LGKSFGHPVAKIVRKQITVVSSSDHEAMVKQTEQQKFSQLKKDKPQLLVQKETYKCLSLGHSLKKSKGQQNRMMI
jgi:hypothetical protein